MSVGMSDYSTPHRLPDSGLSEMKHLSVRSFTPLGYLTPTFSLEDGGEHIVAQWCKQPTDVQSV